MKTTLEWWEKSGPGRGIGGLLSDMADCINNKPSPHSRKGKWTEETVLRCRQLWESTKHLPMFHPDKWTGPRLGKEFGYSSCTALAVAKGEILPRF